MNSSKTKWRPSLSLLFFGNGARGIQCLQAVLEAGYQVKGVVAHPGPSDFANFAKSLSLPFFQPHQVNQPEFVQLAGELGADLFVLSGYNQIFHSELIHLPKKGCINMHGGKLPDYRGTAPVHWQIMEGEKVGGCAILFVDEGIDTGDIISQETYEIAENDTAHDVIQKQLALFPEMLLEALQKLERGTLKRVKQDLREGRYFTRRYPRDGVIHWGEMSAVEIHNKVRALIGPVSPAFCFYKGVRCYLLESRLLPETILGVPGRIALKRNSGVVAIAKDRGLLITKISLENENTPATPASILKMGDDFER